MGGVFLWANWKGNALENLHRRRRGDATDVRLPGRSRHLSPDGKWIARGYQPDPNKQEFKLAILPAAGGGFTKTLEAKKVPVGSKWTPDGKGLTYSTRECFCVLSTATTPFVANLWTQPIAGGPPRQITNFESGNIYAFAWPRDSKHLAVVRGPVTSDVVMISNFRHRE